MSFGHLGTVLSEEFERNIYFYGNLFRNDVYKMSDILLGPEWVTLMHKEQYVDKYMNKWDRFGWLINLMM